MTWTGLEEFLFLAQPRKQNQDHALDVPTSLDHSFDWEAATDPFGSLLCSIFGKSLFWRKTKVSCLCHVGWEQVGDGNIVTSDGNMVLAGKRWEREWLGTSMEFTPPGAHKKWSA